MTDHFFVEVRQQIEGVVLLSTKLSQAENRINRHSQYFGIEASVVLNIVTHGAKLSGTDARKCQREKVDDKVFAFEIFKRYFFFFGVEKFKIWSFVSFL